jgi:hypothetical protein
MNRLSCLACYRRLITAMSNGYFLSEMSQYNDMLATDQNNERNSL